MRYFKFSLNDNTINQTLISFVLIATYFTILIMLVTILTIWEFKPAPLRLVLISVLITLIFAHINYRYDNSNARIEDD